MSYNNPNRQRKPILSALETELNHSSISQKMPAKTITLSRIKNLLLILALFVILYLVFYRPSIDDPPIHDSRAASAATVSSSSTTRRRHLLFAVASSTGSWPRRHSYIRLWYSPDNSTRAMAFLDRAVPADPTLPPVAISADTSRFPYTFPKGLRSAIRVARVVKEAVERVGETAGVRWFVFGDDDTVFFVDNLVKTLSKYDHDRWYYVGSNSESYEQNVKHSFDMAFGGGGFAISYSLARVLARVLDSCLVRYAHLYGSDSRVFSCLVELGVGLTQEPGFHQLDMRGDMFGMLTAHPLSPLVSLHHVDAVDPIFPNMNRTQALEHLFKAVNVDPARILQQTVCYDHSNQLTVSVAWGYAIQVYEGNQLLPDLLSLQRTFTPWRRGSNADAHFMFNMREYPKDSCKRSAVFFLESVVTDKNSIQSNYVKYAVRNCNRANAVNILEKISVFSQKLELDVEEMKSPRRQCCEISPFFNESMVIKIGRCAVGELISMHL
ncbi:hypothetical protein Ddye_017877 [Dipteronia dyeriana]|uniref:Uncharacterized protein n=1 Tax=Dipteronia dyeriana TaxID=168575 RepID=A0AAD9X1C1_9ROSI|nr:hypothetical protein Ddye_017877 [Dipteronia dyeriana]